MRKTIGLAGMLALGLAVPAAADDAAYERRLREQLTQVEASIAEGRFKDEWESLRQFRHPEWFRDAKFGIFIHWGPYSVPAFANEWYSRNMYVPGNPAYVYHRNVYGPQSTFGYKDFIPMFRAEAFDPDAWIDLFARAGARYVMPVAEHCDGFAMYATDFSEWDASEKGPTRDVVGELAQAARERGLHFTLSSHRAEHWWWYYVGRTFDSDVKDPRYAGLYGPAAPMGLPADPPASYPDPGHLQLWTPPDQAFLDDWMARTSELVDKYRPKLIYLDWWTSAPLFEPYMRKLAAYYYGEADAKSFGDVAIVYKGGQFVEGTALFDIERGMRDEMSLTPWQSDTSVSIRSWGYVQDDNYRTAKSLVGDLIDIVSKNGNLLLNVGPRADGVIPEEAQSVLLEMGAWLEINGEGIYESRPYLFFGEGPTRSAPSRVAGQVEQAAIRSYTGEDFRFTTRDGNLYAFGLEYPDEGRALIKTLYAGTPYLDRPVAGIELLGHGEVQWNQIAEGLEVRLPPPSSDMPYTLKFTFDDQDR
jgi:alpha-L-fucosidase